MRSPAFSSMTGKGARFRASNVSTLSPMGSKGRSASPAMEAMWAATSILRRFSIWRQMPPQCIEEQ